MKKNVVAQFKTRKIFKIIEMIKLLFGYSSYYIYNSVEYIFQCKYYVSLVNSLLHLEKKVNNIQLLRSFEITIYILHPTKSKCLLH